MSPRYKIKAISHKEHKRKLSDKLDRLLGDRQNPQQLIQKHILYTTPEVDIESVKEEIARKRDEREKIKKRLKRKLSHDFRPTEQDIEDRGIKIVPESIIEDEEDVSEEVIVYNNANNRQSFSLQKKKSGHNVAMVEEARFMTRSGSRERARDSMSSIESADFAPLLKQERMRNSRKINGALIERPSPSEMIERGYISANDVNEHIPVSSRWEQLVRLRAEVTVESGKRDEHRIRREKDRLRIRRRRNILRFYDQYLFNYRFDDDSVHSEEDGMGGTWTATDTERERERRRYPEQEEHVDIDSDYRSVLNLLQHQHQVAHGGDALFSRSEVATKLYAISEEEQSLEKEWMRNLRKRKFGIYIAKLDCASTRNRRHQIKLKVDEMAKQIETAESTQSVKMLQREISWLEQQRCTLIESTAKQMDDLRAIIKQLVRTQQQSYKNDSFISVSSS